MRGVSNCSARLHLSGQFSHSALARQQWAPLLASIAKDQNLRPAVSPHPRGLTSYKPWYSISFQVKHGASVEASLLCTVTHRAESSLSGVWCLHLAHLPEIAE